MSETIDEWTKIEKSRYDGTCAGCGNKYNTNDAIYVCNGKYFDSTKCVGLVYTGAVEKGKEGSKKEEPSTPSSTPKAVTLVRCENCGEQVDRVTHLIRDGPVEIDLSLCDDCLWLRRASWNLKLNKLWKPTPKNAPVMEAKP